MRIHPVQGSCPPARRAVVRTAAALVAATGLLLGGASAAGATTQATAAPGLAGKAATATMVPIEKNAFMPPALTVTEGQIVTWTNEDDVPHTVTTTSAPVTFDSGTFAKGKSFSYTFTQPGTYHYYCAVHPDMTGEVTVLAKGAAAGPAAKVKPTAPKGDDMAGMDHGNTAGMASEKPAAPSAPAPAAPPAADPVSGAMNPLLAHLQNAHFSRGPGQQVQDISEFDTWLNSHQALFRMMLDPEVGPSSALGTAPMTSVFLQHMDAAHWHRSPMGQANDIADFDSWNKSHLAMFRMMLDPFVGKSSALDTSPGTSVFLQHMDAAHWNKSLNGQATDIIDDSPGWTASHQAMIQMMAGALSSGGSGH
jgi:plastocyanin